MSNHPQHCGMFHGQQPVNLCQPLKQLKQEHEMLRKLMNDYAHEAAAIGKDMEIEDWSEQLNALKDKVIAFVNELDPHSEREEGYLFPLMAKYIGRETGPIAVMEHEHELAKQNLKQFIQVTEQINDTVDSEHAKITASYALKAHAVLSDHFVKEENILFPMAENILSEDDKAELGHAWE